MSLVLKVIGLGFIVCLINPILKRNSPESGAAMTVAASVIIFTAAARLVSEAVAKLQGLGGLFNLNGSYIEVITKAVLIAWVSEYCGSVIADAGENALAKKIEFTGKLVIFIMIFPMVTNLAENVISLIR